MGAGVPSGLQNQREGLGASWVGSIPTYSRQWRHGGYGAIFLPKFVVF